MPPGVTSAANRRWWDGEAPSYYAEHGDYLGDHDFLWCPEGLRESQAGLLGDVDDLRVLEVGCGAAQAARWLWAHGAQVVGVDLSAGMLAQARRLCAAGGPALVQADACALPLADESVDLACSAYGAVPFVDHPERVMAEVARVLRPGGRWVFSVTHPIRWAFPDDPGPGGLTATRNYFDRSPYLERDEAGAICYAEHHRTLGDRIRDIVNAGLVLDALIEPEWPDGNDREWGGWSPLRGRHIPGTAIFVTRLPG